MVRRGPSRDCTKHPLRHARGSLSSNCLLPPLASFSQLGRCVTRSALQHSSDCSRSSPKQPARWSYRASDWAKESFPRFQSAQTGSICSGMWDNLPTIQGPDLRAHDCRISARCALGNTSIATVVRTLIGRLPSAPQDHEKLSTARQPDRLSHRSIVCRSKNTHAHTHTRAEEVLLQRTAERCPHALVAADRVGCRLAAELGVRSTDEATQPLEMQRAEAVIALSL